MGEALCHHNSCSIKLTGQLSSRCRGTIEGGVRPQQTESYGSFRAEEL